LSQLRFINIGLDKAIPLGVEFIYITLSYYWDGDMVIAFSVFSLGIYYLSVISGFLDAYFIILIVSGIVSRLSVLFVLFPINTEFNFDLKCFFWSIAGSESPSLYYVGSALTSSYNYISGKTLINSSKIYFFI
jgi:hypothetical protein